MSINDDPIAQEPGSWVSLHDARPKRKRKLKRKPTLILARITAARSAKADLTILLTLALLKRREADRLLKRQL